MVIPRKSIRLILPEHGLSSLLNFYHRQKALLLILAVGLIVRLAALLFYLDTHNWKGEIWEYEIIANNLLSNKGFTFLHHGTVYQSFLAPVFILVCYALHLIGGPNLVLYYVFHLSTAMGITVLSYWIAKRWVGSRSAIAAASLIAIEPGLVIYQSYKVDVITLASFLILLGIYFFISLTQSEDRFLAIFVGLIMGIGALTRPDLMSMFSLPVAWIFLERKRFLEVLKPATLVILTGFLALSPWFIRNYNIHDQFVFMTTTSGEYLWRGNNPHATGTSETMELQDQFSTATETFRQKILTSSELQQRDLFKAEALRFITENPGTFLWNTLKKFYYFWWFTPTYGSWHSSWIPHQLIMLYPVLYAVILAFALYGFSSIIRDQKPHMQRTMLYLLIVIISIGIIHSIYYVEGRHRVLVMPIILILTAHGIVALRDSKLSQQNTATPPNLND